MKKTLIAIAALAATGAFAQSSVTISGSFEAGIVSFDQKGQKVTGIGFNQSSTSGLNFSGTSDLGGGLRANFKLGTDINPVSAGGNTGTPGNVGVGANTATASQTSPTGSSASTNGTAGRFGGAESFVNLQGGFGKVALGLPNGLGLGAHGTSQPFGTAIGSGFRSTSTQYTSVVRYDNSLRYDSPVLFGGVTLSYLGRKQQADAATSNYNEALGAQDQAAISEIGASYNAGPLNIAFARTTEDALNVGTYSAAGTIPVSATVAGVVNGNKVTANALAANYTFGATTVYAGFQSAKAANGAGVAQRDTTGMNLAVRHVMGVHSMMANYGRTSGALTAANVASSTNTSSNLLGLGYEYALSKTAAITVRHERIADTLGVAATTGYTPVTGNTDRTRTGAGIRVAF